MIKKVELLAPAGDLEKLKIAMDYGADAVYCGGENFGLRAGSNNFTLDELKEGIDYVHGKEGKLYLTMNIFAHNEDIDELGPFIEDIKGLGIDGFIVSDPGVFSFIKSEIPHAEIHISTQANVTNKLSALYWHKQGAKRIVLARELSLGAIKEIREAIPENLELEAFVHGAMCMAYSGRCLLSNFMTGRDANRGKCAHPCRWKYRLVEEKRPGEYYPIYEDDRGSYILNSGDLCMIGHIPDLINSGLSSLKIEGRVKSLFYTATITGAYRKAIDAYYEGKYDDGLIEKLKNKVSKVSHRKYITGFYFDKPSKDDHGYDSADYEKARNFTGLVKSYNEESKIALIEQRNKMVKGDTIQVFGPGQDAFEQTIEKIWDEEGEEIEAAPHPQQLISIKMLQAVGENYIVSTEKK